MHAPTVWQASIHQQSLQIQIPHVWLARQANIQIRSELVHLVIALTVPRESTQPSPPAQSAEIVGQASTPASEGQMQVWSVYSVHLAPCPIFSVQVQAFSVSHAKQASTGLVLPIVPIALRENFQETLAAKANLTVSHVL